MYLGTPEPEHEAVEQFEEAVHRSEEPVSNRTFRFWSPTLKQKSVPFE